VPIFDVFECHKRDYYSAPRHEDSLDFQDYSMRRIGRRMVIKRGIRLSLGVGLGLAPTLGWGQEDPASIRPQEGDLLIKAGEPRLTPLTPDDIPLGAMQTMAWAMDPMDNTVRSGSRLNRVLLLRLDVETLTPDTRSRAADGVVAYTAICTHSGCEVEEWLTDDQLLYCSCHSSKFDPKDSARVLDGPAPRMLPALPLKLLNGKLVVAKPFTARVGFESF
jgi:rieske iron-sulfur protein